MYFVLLFHCRRPIDGSGRTELDAPGLEFRYCSKCQGDHEYCMEHLYTHVHVGAEHTEADDAGGSQTEN